MKPADKAVATRRLYCFENIIDKDLPYYARRERRLDFLQAVATKVWRFHGRRGLPCPDVRFGPGLVGQSYAHGYKIIELAPTKKLVQRCVATLLHELTHCMGYGRPHGRGFARKYLELLVEFGQCEEGELELAMGLFRVKH